MRLAVIADIHGSMPSLNAALHEIHEHPVDGILVAGDMTCGPNSVEVLQRLQEEKCWMVLGNNEGYLLRFDFNEAPAWWYTSQQWAFNRWVYQHMDRSSLDFLRSLPEQRVIDIPGTAPIRLFHGTPRDTSEHLCPGLNPESLPRTFAETREAVLACGHSHVPWQVRQNGRLVFNPGAIFFPDNGSFGAQYALLTWETNHWGVEHRSVAYDHALVRADYQDSGLLEEGGAFARACLLSLETGRSLAVEFLAYAFNLAAKSGITNCEFIPDDTWNQAAETFDWEKPSQTKRRIS
jgi:putative phosphoesterase